MDKAKTAILEFRLFRHLRGYFLGFSGEQIGEYELVEDEPFSEHDGSSGDTWKFYHAHISYSPDHPHAKS